MKDAALHHYHNIKISRLKKSRQKQKYMRCSKGYTDKLEKLICDDGGVTLTIKLKKAAEKNETVGYCLFTGWILLY